MFLDRRKVLLKEFSEHATQLGRREKWGTWAASDSGGRSKVLLMLGAIALVASAIPGTALASSTSAADKQPMTSRPNILCDGSTPPGTPTQSSAIIKVFGGNGKVGPSAVVAQVEVQNSRPNTEIDVELHQTPSTTCSGAAVGSITTNGQGNGTTKLVAPLRPGATGAWVAAFPGGSPPNILVSGVYVFGNK